jgi:hypothetical protein
MKTTYEPGSQMMEPKASMSGRFPVPGVSGDLAVTFANHTDHAVSLRLTIAVEAWPVSQTSQPTGSEPAGPDGQPQRGSAGSAIHPA